MTVYVLTIVCLLKNSDNSLHIYNEVHKKSQTCYNKSDSLQNPLQKKCSRVESFCVEKILLGEGNE